MSPGGVWGRAPRSLRGERRGVGRSPAKKFWTISLRSHSIFARTLRPSLARERPVVGHHHLPTSRPSPGWVRASCPGGCRRLRRNRRSRDPRSRGDGRQAGRCGKEGTEGLTYSCTHVRPCPGACMQDASLGVAGVPGTVARARGGVRPRSGITPPSLSPRCASPGASPPPARAPGASITPRGADGYGVTVDLATRGGGRQVSAGRSHLPAWRVHNLLTRKYLANRYATLSQARYSRQPSDQPTHNRHRALEIEPSGAYILLRGSARSHASFFLVAA